MPEFMFCIFGYCRQGCVIFVFLQIGIKSIYTLKVFHFLTISFALGIMVKQISYSNELDRDDRIIHIKAGKFSNGIVLLKNASQILDQYFCHVIFYDLIKL